MESASEILGDIACKVEGIDATKFSSGLAPLYIDERLSLRLDCSGELGLLDCIISESSYIFLLK